MENIWKVEIIHGADYIDFYFADKENPTRVEGCYKYREQLNNFLNNLFQNIEKDFNQIAK